MDCAGSLTMFDSTFNGIASKSLYPEETRKGKSWNYAVNGQFVGPRNEVANVLWQCIVIFGIRHTANEDSKCVNLRETEMDGSQLCPHNHIHI